MNKFVKQIYESKSSLAAFGILAEDGFVMNKFVKQI